MKLFLACLGLWLGLVQGTNDAATDAISKLLEASQGTPAVTASAEKLTQTAAQPLQRAAQPSQISMLLAQTDSDRYQEAHEDLNNPHVAHVAGALTDLLKEEGAAATTADQAILDTMLTVLNVTMKDRLFEADSRAQQTIDDASSAISACASDHDFSLLAKSSRVSTKDSKKSMPAWYSNYFESYAECKSFEETLKANVSKCSNYCVNETETICAESPDCSQDVCTEPPASVKSGSAYRSYLMSNIRRLQDLIYEIENPNCTTHVTNTQSCYADCLGVVAPVMPHSPTTLPTCCAPRQQAETLQCQNLLTKRKNWLLYDTCYDDKIVSYNSVVSQEMPTVDSRTRQMRAILRMICFVESFGENQATKIQACMDKRYDSNPDVLAMNLKAPEVPTKLDQFTCPSADLPGSPEWDKEHYGDLPTGLQACPATNCQAACNVSSSQYVTHWNLSSANGTTHTTTVVHGRVDCVQQTSSYGVQWDMHSVQSPLIAAAPSGDMVSVAVYVQDGLSGDGLSPHFVLCGSLTSVKHSVDCSQVAPEGGQYLRLFGDFEGVVTSGSGHPSWCHMTIDGSPAPEPQSGGITTSTGLD